MRNTLAILLFLVLLAGSVLAQEPFVWWEGEDFSRGNFPERSAFSPAGPEESRVLSGGAWVTHAGEFDPGLFLEYEVEIPREDNYRFYVRKFWKHGPFRWRFDEGEWQLLTRDEALLESVPVRKQLSASWVLAGKVHLAAGKHRLRIEPVEEPKCTFGLDVLLLTPVPFTPRGKLKPGEKTGLADPDTWAFEPDPDTFAPDALLNLRHLNEEVAGQSGFVRLSEDGNDLLLGDGTPVRFWAVNSFVYRQDMDALRAHAKFLARRGVNVVKFHDYVYPKNPGADITEVDEEVMDWCWKLVAAMKAEGIYTIISPYWALNVKRVPESWGIEGWPEDQSPQGLLFFNERLQEGYRAWMRSLYTRENPYTGIPLARDPAVAAAILQTEDGLLFWTFDQLKGPQRAKLRRQYGRWLLDRYGDLHTALEAWAGEGHENDDFAAGEVGLCIVWHMTGAAAPYSGQNAGMQKRLDDQLRFMTELVRDFNEEMVNFYRKELRCGFPILAGNWKTADQARLLDAMRWSYMPGDIIGCQRYVGPVHVNPDEGRRATYVVDEGDLFAERPAVLYPDSLPIAARQLEGRPWMNTESTWISPTAYQAEGPFMIAAYGAMTGVDGYTWFACSSPQWDQDMTKFQVANPSILGMFPAAALIYRCGYVAEAKPIVREHRTLKEVWARELPLLVEGGGFDPTRDHEDTAVDQRAHLPQPSFLAGAVRVSYGEEHAPDHTAPKLHELVDEAGRVVTSATGELSLDYGRGICTMNAPRAQGVAGFVGERGKFELRDATIECGNRYAAVTLVPLDGRPLNESRRVLAQVGTVCRPHGWRTEPAEFKGRDGATYGGKRITTRGRPPWNIERADVAITLHNPHLAAARRLDPNGMPTGQVTLARAEDGAVQFRFPEDALYVVLMGDWR